MTDKLIEFSIKDLNQYLTCILCNGYYRDAHTIAECMHTFCKSCIYKHFHSKGTKGSVTCPTCDPNHNNSSLG